MPEGFDKINKIVLSGGGAMIGDMASFMKERFNVDVEILNPFNNVEYNAELMGESSEKIGPLVAHVMGLAIREE